MCEAMIKIKQLLNSDYCLQCKGCCYFSSESWGPKLLEQEKARIGLKEIRLRRVNAKSIICEFLKDDSHECRIYSNRPFECALYPFLLVKRDVLIDLAAHIGCSYVKDNFSSDEFKQYVLELLKLIKTPEILQIISENKKNFYSYPEVELYIIERDILKK